jgi:hypothetical protein
MKAPHDREYGTEDFSKASYPGVAAVVGPTRLLTRSHHEHGRACNWTCHTATISWCRDSTGDPQYCYAGSLQPNNADDITARTRHFGRKLHVANSTMAADMHRFFVANGRR